MKVPGGPESSPFASSNRGETLMAFLVGGIQGFRYMFSSAYRDQVWRFWAKDASFQERGFVTMFIGVTIYVVFFIIIVGILWTSWHV